MSKQESIICHIDVNSAYLSWTAVYRMQFLGESLDLRTVPAVIGGSEESRHGIVLAKSGPAKKYGIKTGEPLFQARQKCPQLIVVPPDHALYAEASRQLIRLLQEISPVVDQYSIDEAWIDLSGMERLYGPPVLAAERIKNRIREELGFTVNIGVSSNKLLAKMASDFQKPDLVHTLFPEEIPDKLWPLPVRELFYVGSSTEKKLLEMGIRTIGQLAAADPQRLRQKLHQHGLIIWEFANGRCGHFLDEQHAENKSYGNSTTTGQDVVDRATAHRILLSLCESVGSRLRKDAQQGSCISVTIRSSSFANSSQQMQLPFPTAATMEIFRAACRVFDRLWDGRTPLRLLGVSMSSLEKGEDWQPSLFQEANHEKLSKADAAIDQLRSRFGKQAIVRASLLQNEKKEDKPKDRPAFCRRADAED